MEDWECLLEKYPKPDKIKAFENALHIAQGLLAEDLTPFEIDWFLAGLLTKPVALLETVASQSSEDAWSKLINQAFVLLADIVKKFENAGCYYEDIEMLCVLSYPAAVRAKALACLSQLARRHRPRADTVRAQEQALVVDDACKAVRWELLGVLCEHHPEMFPDVTTLWRTLLNMLNSQTRSAKLSLTVVREVLLAASRLFKHFGEDLVVREMYEFYEEMKAYVGVSKCREVCCVILENYSDLFKEKISPDARLRADLWNPLDKASRAAVIAVYRTCFEAGTHLQEIIAELVAKSSSENPLTKFTALRVLGEAQRSGHVALAAHDHVNVQLLERSLRDGTAHEHAEAISWCIGAHVLDSDRVLQAAILYHDALPASARYEAVVRNILEAPPEIRTPAIVFLTTETCTARDDSQRELLMSIWRGLLGSPGDMPADGSFLRNWRHVLEDYVQHATFLLETFLKDEAEELPSKVSALLDLTAFVFHTQKGGEHEVASIALARVLLSYLRTYSCAASVRAARALAACGAEINGFYECIDVNGCDDDQLLVQSCLALLEAPAALPQRHQVLLAAKVLLSRSDTEPAILSEVLKKVESLILNRNEELDTQLLHEIMYLVENIREGSAGGSREQRILHRDAVMFIGKFGTNDAYNKVDSCGKVLATRLNELCLNIPNEGNTLKLDLSGVLEHAVAAEDPDALQTLVTILCANSRDPPAPAAGAALCRAVAALSRRSEIAARAAPFCGLTGAHSLLTYASSETSPRARRVLLGAVRAALAGGSQQQAARLAERVLCAAAARDDTNQTKLDLLSTLVRAMEKDNMLSQNYLPKVLISISKTQLSTTPKLFEEASKLLVDKISLFEDKQLTSLIYDVVDGLREENAEVNAKSIRIMAKIGTFVKKLYAIKKNAFPDIMVLFERTTDAPRPRVLYALSDLKSAFECDLTFCRELVTRRNRFFEEFFDLTISEDSAINSILYFICTFSEVLLEIYYEKTLGLLSELIRNMTPEQVIYSHKRLSSCVDAVKRCLNNVPRVLHESGGAWLRASRVNGITESLIASEERACASVAEALTYIVGVFDVTAASPCDIRPAASEWLTQIRAIAPDDMSDRDATCLTDLVRVCLSVLSPAAIRAIICGEDIEDTLWFCRTYISAFSKFFIKQPFVLLKESWSQLALILNDVVRDSVTRRRGQLKDILQLVEELWPAYAARSDLKQKYSLLLELSPHSPKLSPESSPMQWVRSALAAATTGDEDKIRLIALVPGGDAYGSTYAAFANAVPARLVDTRALSACALRALLDAAARTRDRQLLALLARLAAGDSSRGWWDAAFDDCMKELAVDAHTDLLEHVYRLSCGGGSTGACERLLIPLLRYVSPSVCEEWLSVVLEELFSVLKRAPREGASGGVLQRCVADYVCAFDVLRIAFEKIPKQHIESPRSVLYSRLQQRADRPFLLAYTVCVLGAQLRAARALAAAPRMFHCAAYNCMTAALCCRCPKPQIYAAVFDVAVWGSLVDESVEYHLPLAVAWKQPTTRQAVSIDISQAEHALLSAGTPSRSVHFLRTLSEDPFLYDIPEVEDTSTPQELQLLDNPLNRHECAATLTALFCHAVTVDGLDWIGVLCAALDRDPRASNKNVRWLLAQVICNCKEELKPHAAALRPKLLALVADTGARTLNGLHLEIINTLIYWREDEATVVDGEHVNSVVKSLMGALREHAGRRVQVAALLSVLDKVTEMYGPRLTLPEEYCDAIGKGLFGAGNQLGLNILKIFAKNKVEMKDVAERVFAAHKRLDASSVAAVGRALGLAAAALPALAPRVLQLAARLRKDGSLQQYIGLVYYAQKQWPGCCDDKIVRDIADLANKIPGSEKRKCLDIVATYLAHASPGEHVDALFDTLDISQLVAAGQGLQVVERGLPLMQERLRRRVTQQLAGEGAASAARSQLLAALKVALSSPGEPQSKKRRMESAILSHELRPVLSALSQTLTDDAVVEIGALLAGDHALRFCESFALAVYYPLTSGRTGSAASAHRTLELFMQRVRSQEVFLSARLREEPLHSGSGVQPACTSLSAEGPRGGGQLVADAADEAPLDVRMPLEEVLSSILRFAKQRPAVASELCAQVGRAARGGPAEDTLCGLLRELMPRATPLVLQLCRLYVDGCCAQPGFAEALQALAPRGAGCGLVRALQQEVRLRDAGPRSFVMGSVIDSTDVETPQEKKEFSINDLVASFGTLAHWQQLPASRRRELSRGMPVLWTSEDTFRRSLEQYEGEGWFGEMVSVYRGAGGERGRGRWPTRKFDVSAMAETIEWRYIRDESRSEEDLRRLTAHMGRDDCLAEWAARLMLRRLFIRTVEVEPESVPSDSETERSLKRTLSLSHQLQWCMRANEMELPAPALQCLEDVSGLFESETLQWAVQKMAALRAANRRREALDLYERTAQFRAAAAPGDVLRAELERLRLLEELAVLTPDSISSMREELQNRERVERLARAGGLAATLDSVFAIVMGCLYEKCLEDFSLLLEMCNMVAVYAALRPGCRTGWFADMIIQRVAERDHPLPPHVASAVLGTLSTITDDLDEFALELVRKSQRALCVAPSSYSELFAADESLAQAKLMLSLVADPAHCLLQYCGALLHAALAGNEASWTLSFARMKAKMFENPFAGPDYQVLAHHKQALYPIEQYDEARSADRRQLLQRLVQELRGPARRGLRLPRLCPALAALPAAGRALRALLRLPPGAALHFDEEVYVYTESLRRPALLTVRGAGAEAGDGVRRYIVKSGEALRCDAAARRCYAAIAAAAGADVGGYWVTPLSEDCGLVEFLEEHETVRSLIIKAAGTEIAGILTAAAAAGDSARPGAAAEDVFQRNCAKVPADLLRRAIEDNSTSAEVFTRKAARFTDSLSTATLVSWLLGVGDRHLENVLYSLRDGSLCSIDWGALGQYGRVELPCARLTRNLLAVCDMQALESRLQGAVRALRRERRALAAVLHVSLAWTEDFPEKMEAIRQQLRGGALPHQLTVGVLRRARGEHDEHVALLQQVFSDVEQKPLYTVEEQVAFLLRQCTDPRILSITRSRWEPWL